MVDKKFLKSLGKALLWALLFCIVQGIILGVYTSYMKKPNSYGNVTSETVDTDTITSVNQADNIVEVADAIPSDTQVTSGVKVEDIAADETSTEEVAEEADNLTVLLERYPDYVDTETFEYEDFEVPSSRKVLLKVKNLKDAESVGIGLVVFYDESGNPIDASSYSTGVIDKLSSTYAYVFTPEVYDSYKVRLMPDYVLHNYAKTSYDNVTVTKEEYGNIFGVCILNDEDTEINIRYSLLIVYKDGVPVDCCVNKPLKTKLRKGENTTVTFNTKLNTYDSYEIVCNAYKN